MGNQMASTIDRMANLTIGNRKRISAVSAEPLSSSWKQAKHDFTEDSDDLNGFILNGVLVPESALEIILSYASPDSALIITQVCRAWKDITTRRSFWKLVLGRCGGGVDWNSIPEHVKERDHSWMVFYAVSKNQFFSKNLIKNPSGNDQFENWVILRAGGRGGNNFAIESPPVGIDGLPPRDDAQFEGLNDAAFATSYEWCSKQQKIDLWEIGLTPAVMRTMLPFQFTLSEMVGSRFDCGGMYRIHVCLQNHSNDEITEEDLLEGTRQSGAGWGEITYSLKVDLDPTKSDKLNDIRYFVLTNHGKDNQFWAGHYGIKFSRISVTVKCLSPSETVETVEEESQGQSNTPLNLSARSRTVPSAPGRTHGLPVEYGYYHYFGDNNPNNQFNEDHDSDDSSDREEGED